MIDVDAAAENTMVVFSAIEELRKDTEEGWCHGHGNFQDDFL